MNHPERRERRALGEASDGARQPHASEGQIRESAQEHWSELTDDDLEDFDGRADRLSHALRKRYGWSDEEIEAEIEWWEEDSGNELF